MIEEFNTDNPDYPWIEKRVGEKLDYTWDATKDLGVDTIQMVTIDHHPSLTKTNQAFDSVKASAWFSGGIVGEDVWITFTLQTAAGRILVRTIYLRIIPR